MPNIVVIGAGVTGLSAAVRLQETLPPAPETRITILARDFPAPFETIDRRAQIDYTSPWGGAHNRWIPPVDDASSPTAAADRRDHAFSLATFAHMEATAAAHPEAGITFLPGIEYLEAPPPALVAALTESRARDEFGMRGFRLLPASGLPTGVRWGCAYDTWCVNPMVYCAFLLRRFTVRGGRAVRRELARGGGAAEVFGLPPGELGFEGGVDVVVNCSGVGFGDGNVFITRGQTCLVANPCAATVTRQNADGSWSFSVPRGFDGGTVIGGTKQPDDWDPEPSAAVRARLLRAFAETYPPVLGEKGEFEVLADIVGRRPTRRGGMRLEAEEVVLGTEGEGEKEKKKGAVVHAYGLGGRGYELSWGVAGAVVGLVRAQLAGGGGWQGEAVAGLHK